MHAHPQKQVTIPIQPQNRDSSKISFLGDRD
jgi:hypothetical protein